MLSLQGARGSSTETIPLWSIAKRVVECNVADQVYQLTRNTDKNWLQMPCAPMPLKEDTLKDTNLPMVAITAVVGSSQSQGVFRQHLVRNDAFWAKGAPAVSNAYLQYKTLTDDAANWA